MSIPLWNEQQSIPSESIPSEVQKKNDFTSAEVILHAGLPPVPRMMKMTCYCEERSDEAISAVKEIAAPSPLANGSQRHVLIFVGLLNLVREKGFGARRVFRAADMIPYGSEIDIKNTHMIIDAHSHGFHGGYLDRLADAGGEAAQKLVDQQRQIASDRPMYLDVPLRLELISKHGIDLQVVTPSSQIEVNNFPGDGPTRLALARALNDNMARIMDDSGGKLLSIGTVPLEVFEPGGRQEMERVIGTLGLKGINLPTHVSGKPLDSAEFEPFWSEAEKMDIVVYIHPRDTVSHLDRKYEYEYGLPAAFSAPFETTLALARLVFSGVMERYPRLKILAHHLGGGMIPFFWGRMLELYEPREQPGIIGRTLPRPLIDYFSRFYCDTAVGNNPPAVRCAYEVFGADRLVFATDAPFGPEGGEWRLASYSKMIERLNVPREEIDKILSGNARRMLKLD